MTNTFDAANRLTSSSRATATVQPIYNGVGDRVRQTVGATTTYYTLDVEGLPEVITSAGEIYLHLPGVIVTEKAGQVRYLLGDGLGSIRQAIDGTGAVVAYSEFDPWGNPVQEGSQPYGFTGEWWQDELDLLHLRARWYMASTSEDAYEQERQKVRKICKVLSEQDSQEVWDSYNFIQGWKNWYARKPEASSVGWGKCNDKHEWPSEFSSLTNLRVQPQLNSWWWITTGPRLSYGSLLTTEKPRVFRLRTIF